MNQSGNFREISRNAKDDFAKKISRKLGAKNGENGHGRFLNHFGSKFGAKRGMFLTMDIKFMY